MYFDSTAAMRAIQAFVFLSMGSLTNDAAVGSDNKWLTLRHHAQAMPRHTQATSKGWRNSR